MKRSDMQKPVSLANQIAKEIEQWIFQEVYKPGEQIKESHIAKKLGVSQTPVREALRSLEERGFITHKPNVGNTVIKLDEYDIKSILEIRMLLEPQALELARKNATTQEKVELKTTLNELGRAADDDDLLLYHDLHTRFHEMIWTIGHNKWLHRALSRLVTPLWATYRQKMRETKQPLGGYRTHSPLLEYIEGKIEVDARKLIEEHGKR